MIKMAFLNLQPQNYPQPQNLPTTINFDWLNKYNNLPQQQSQPLQNQPFLNLQYPRTDIDFLNLNKDGIKYSRDIDGNLSRVAGATATAENPSAQAVENAPEIATTEAGNVQKQLQQPTPATTPETQAQPVQPTTQQTEPTKSISDTLQNYKNARNALNGNQNQGLLNLKDAMNNTTLQILPRREDNLSLSPLLNLKPENYTPQEWGYLGDVYAAKQLYDQTSDNINWANKQLEGTNLTDDRRQAITNYRDRQNQLRENAMNTAEMTRKTALENGFDVDANGMSALGDSLGASTQALNYLQERNRKSLLNLPTPRTFNRQRRDELKKEGYNPFHALVLANEETRDYVDDASNKLLWAMQMNGTTNGVINNNGVGYLKQLLKIDPASANMFAQEFASPAQGFAAQNQTLNNILNNDNALQRLLLNIAAQQQHQDKDIQARFGILDKQQTWQGEQNALNRDLDIKRLNATQAKELAKNELEFQKFIYNNDPEIQIQKAKYYADWIFGEGDSPEKQQWIATSLNAHHKPLDMKKSDEVSNQVHNRLQTIKQALLNGEVDDDNNEVAKTELASLKADLRNTEKDFYGKLDPKIYHDAMRMTDYYDKVINGNMSLWDVYDLDWRIQNEGRDPDTNENGDPIWYIKMNPEERKIFDKYMVKEVKKQQKNQQKESYSNSPLGKAEKTGLYYQFNPYGTLQYQSPNLWNR